MLLLAAVLALAMVSQDVGGTGVGVWNSPPTFVSMSIPDTDTEIAVVINVSDYNGWADIYMVVLTVKDDAGAVVQEVVYKQYPANTSSVRVDTFEETAGSFMKPKNPEDPYSGCRVRRFSGVGWFEDNTTQEVTFLFHPFAGSTIDVLMEDSKGLTSFHEGPFTDRFKDVLPPPPPVFDNPAVPVTISTMVAAVGAAVAVTGRMKSNKMARMVMRMKGGV